MYTYVHPGQVVRFNRQRNWRRVLSVETNGFQQTVQCSVTTGIPMQFRTKSEIHMYDVRFDCLTVKL